jgi:hypothetical protein
MVGVQYCIVSTKPRVPFLNKGKGKMGWKKGDILPELYTTIDFTSISFYLTSGGRTFETEKFS